jgi:hypothetical protein
VPRPDAGGKSGHAELSRVPHYRLALGRIRAVLCRTVLYRTVRYRTVPYVSVDVGT